MSLWAPARLGDEDAERLAERYLRTLDPALLRAEIEAAVARGDVEALAIERLDIQPLDIKWDRFIVFVDIEDARHGRLTLVAKGYQDDRVVRVARNHRLLWEAGVRTSRPWGIVGPLGISLSERLPGSRPALSDEVAAGRAAHAAAVLHASDAVLEPAFTLEGALHNAERHARRLARRAPAVAEEVLAIAERSRAVAAAVATPVELRPVHGDLSPDGLLLAGDRTFLFDWDMSCRFDPAWDVGHFLAQQRRWGLETGVETDAVRAAFLATYLEARGDDAGFAARVAFYESLTYLHKSLTVHRTPHEALIPELLRLADAGMAALA